MAPAPATAPRRPWKLGTKALAALFPEVVAVALLAEVELLAVADGELGVMGGGKVDPAAFISNVVEAKTCMRRIKR